MTETHDNCMPNINSNFFSEVSGPPGPFVYWWKGGGNTMVLWLVLLWFCSGLHVNRCALHAIPGESRKALYFLFKWLDSRLYCGVHRGK